MKNNLILIFLILFSFFIRIYKIDKAPVALFGDEIDVGYQAYSILKTGKDIRGYTLPVYIHSLSESRAPLFIYSAIPFVAIFGLNEFGVRLPSVFFGTLSILLLYLAVNKFFKSKKLALWSSFVMSISPWHLHYSRAGFEVTLLISLILLGLIFFEKGFSNKNNFIVSTLFFSLSIYTYSTAIVFVPLLVLLLIFLFNKKIDKLFQSLIIIAVSGLIFALPFFYSFINGQSQERFSRISVFGERKILDRIVLQRNEDGNKGRIYHNKITSYFEEVTNNILTSFSFPFLFTKGDPNMRHSSGTGLLYYCFLPFLILGCYFFFQDRKNKFSLLILLFLFISILPSSLTYEGGSHATRLFLAIIPFSIIIGKGIFEFCNYFNKNKKITLCLCFIFILSLINYGHNYFFHFPIHSWESWNYGYKEIFQSDLVKFENNFEKIVINNNHGPMLQMFLFWTKKDPNWLRNNFTDDKMVINVLPGFDGFKVGKYYFGNLKEKNLMSFLDSKTLYLGFQKDEIPGDWNWYKSPPKGIKAVAVSYDYLKNPYMYLLTKNEE